MIVNEQTKHPVPEDQVTLQNVIRRAVDALHGHILNVHHDNTCEGADGEIKGTVHGSEESANYGGSK